jgi:hypothetical protein
MIIIIKRVLADPVIGQPSLPIPPGRTIIQPTTTTLNQTDRIQRKRTRASSTHRLRNDDVPFSVISITTIMRMMTRSTLTVKNLSSRSHEEIRHPITVI